MFFLNILSGAIYSAHAFPEAMAEIQKNAEAQAHWYHVANQNGTAAMNGNMTEIDRNLTAQFELFKEEMGFDPIQLFGWMEPNVLLAFVSLAWFTFATLSLYVARLWWNSLKKAFSPTPATSTPEKLHDV